MTERDGPNDPQNPTTEPPPAPSGAGTAAPAGLGIRIGARLLDVLLVGIPASIVLSIFGMQTALAGVIVSLLWFGYFVWFESNQGATVGKKLLNLSVNSMAGGLPDPATAAKRNIWMLFGLIPVVGGLLGLIAVIAIMITIASGDDNLGYHDKFAGTQVKRNPA